MALPSRYGIEKKLNSMEGLSAYENGGKGSGNFGHSGRPGEVGGSAPSGGGSSSASPKSEKRGRSKEEQIDEQFEKGLITESERDELKAQAKEARKAPSGQDAMKWARENKDIYDHSKLKSDEMSFDDILRSMHDGQDFYQTTGVQDSMDREKFFDEIAKRTGLDYDDVYATWLHGSKVDLDPSNVNYEPDTKSVKKVAKYLKGLGKKKNSLEETLTNTIMKTLNGGKGSGNFGHAGRPGKVGGSSSGGGYVAEDGGHQGGNDRYEFGVEGYTQSTTELEKLFPEGSTFYDKEGNEMTVQRGANGLEGVSKDGRIVTAIPGDILDSTAKYMASDGGANNAGKRLSAWGEVVQKMYEAGMPKMAGEEVMRYAKAEHDFASTKENRKKNLKRVQSYADTARGALYAYVTGNGGVNTRDISSTAKKGAKALSDQIKYGRLCAEDIAKE